MFKSIICSYIHLFTGVGCETIEVDISNKECAGYIHMFTGVGCETKMIFMFTIASETKAFVKKAGI